MRDPGGEGIYYVNGKSTGYLTAYHVHSKESVDIVAEDATQPTISPDGKRVMYVTLPAPYKTDPWVSDKTELWVSDIEGGNKVKVATGVSLQTGTWASDNFHLTFIEAGVGAASRAYIVGADGAGLDHLPPTGSETNTAVWSPDHKSVYLSVVEKVGSMATVWKWSVGDSNLEKIVDDCGQVSDVDPSGRYLLGNVLQGERIGIYEVSVSDRRCFPLLPGIPTFAATFARDGKSFMYAVASGGDVKIYRQPWKKGKTVGTPQVALKVPFVFPLAYQGNGNAYDFSRAAFHHRLCATRRPCGPLFLKPEIRANRCVDQRSHPPLPSVQIPDGSSPADRATSTRNSRSDTRISLIPLPLNLVLHLPLTRSRKADDSAYHGETPSGSRVPREPGRLGHVVSCPEPRSYPGMCPLPAPAAERCNFAGR